MLTVRRLVQTALVVALAAFGLLQLPPPADAEVQPSAVVAYAYDGQHPTTIWAYAITARGSPATHYRDTVHVADDHSSLGALARRGGAKSWATTTYTTHAKLAQGARATGAMEAGARVAYEHLVGFLGAGVAANSGRALVDASKYDYLFGNVASNAHNAARSAQNAQQLARIGVHNNATGRSLLSSHFDDVVSRSDNIARTFQVRDSLFSGPGGFLKFESTWQVTDDGLRLTTVIPRGGP